MKVLLALALVTTSLSLSNCTSDGNVASSPAKRRKPAPPAPAAPKRRPTTARPASIDPATGQNQINKARGRASGLFHARIAPILPRECASFGMSRLNMHAACKFTPHAFVTSSMKLSLFTDYSLRVLMFAALKGESFSLSEVAEAYDISRHHLVKVVNYLAKLGYLETRRGRGGGISLGDEARGHPRGHGRAPHGGMPPLVECFDKDHNTCVINGSCRLKGALAQAVNAFSKRWIATRCVILSPAPMAPT
jgi:Rrf2 family nitric oxide-sensitive transcriptional repressor